MQIFRDDPDRIRADFFKRGINGSIIDEVLLLDSRWREVRFEVDQLRKSRNSAARLISEAKKKGDEEEVDAILGKVSNLGSKIEDLEEEAEQLIFKRDSIRMQIPNLLHKDVPTGENDQKNVEISRHGEPPSFDFKPRTHNEIIEKTGGLTSPEQVKLLGQDSIF